MSDFTPNKNILLLGSSSSLGIDLEAHFVAQGHNVLCPPSSVLDITNEESLISYLDSLPFNLHRVVNLARYTKTGAEDFEELMVLGVQNLCFWCKKLGITYVHLSTDQIFDGTKGSPYIETDLSSPTTVFGQVSASSEDIVKSVFADSDRYYIFRVSWVFSNNPCSENQEDVVQYILNHSKDKEVVEFANNIFGNPSNTKILSMEIEKILNTQESNSFGIYHLSPFDSCSMYDLAREVLKGEKQVVPVVSPVNPNYTINNAVLAPTKVGAKEGKSYSNINFISWKTHLDCYKSNSLSSLPACYESILPEDASLVKDQFLNLSDVLRDMESVPSEQLPEVEISFGYKYSDLVAVRDYFNSVK